MNYMNLYLPQKEVNTNIKKKYIYIYIYTHTHTYMFLSLFVCETDREKTPKQCLVPKLEHSQRHLRKTINMK